MRPDQRDSSNPNYNYVMTVIAVWLMQLYRENVTNVLIYTINST